jgi:hypothetical protein
MEQTAQSGNAPPATSVFDDRLRKLHKKQLKELAKSLGVSVRQLSKASKDDIISSILWEIKNGTLRREDVEKELAKEEYKIPPRLKEERLTRKVFDDFRQEVVLSLSLIKSNLSELSQLIETFREEVSNRLANLERAIEVSIDKLPPDKLLRVLRQLGSNLERPEDFTKCIQELKKEGVDLNELAKTANLIMAISKLKELIKGLSWPEDLDYFYRALRDEFYKLRKKTGGPVPIPQMRDILTNKLGISSESFNARLIECYMKGWIQLDLSSPLGEVVEPLDIEGRKYYIIRSLIK